MVTSQHEGATQVTILDPGYTGHMLRALFAELPIPESGEARLASPDFSQVDPGVCRADGAILYGKGEEKFGVVIETQRQPDEDKWFSWLEYLANFRAREQCPAALIVICPNRATARWARGAIETGHPGLTLIPLVIGPDNTPVITDITEAQDNILLAVISAITKSNDPGFGAIIRTMSPALQGIDRKLAGQYARYIYRSLKGEPQREWGRLMAMQTHEYQGDFAEGLLAEGRAQGRVEGRAEDVLKVLEVRGIALSDKVRERVMACQDPDMLSAWLLKAVTVQSADELFV
jgi:hypothetical protein